MADEPQTVSSSPVPPKDDVKQSQQQAQIPVHPNFGFQAYPVMYPTLVPGTNPLQPQDQMNRGAGIYAVAVLPPFMGQVAGLPSNALIPLTYKVPTTRASVDAEAAGTEQGRTGEHQQQQHAPQRRDAPRRFRFAFPLDFPLMFKLAAVVFLFNQDGSRHRLAVLVFCAGLVYLYQTDALTPFVRWLSQGMQRAAAPPQPPRPAARADNVPLAAGQRNANALGENQGRADDENRPLVEGGDRVVENENVAEQAGGNQGNRWWGIVKEIQIIVFGFITSLLPGFQNVD